MARTKRLIRSFFRLLFPVVVLSVVGVLAAGVWFVHTSSKPPKTAYLVTPEKYGRLSTRGAKVTDETWSNRDGSQARGWLLRGNTGAPAVILLHRYGADRSHMLNLGVKLNEVTDFTILMPDMRGHGENPPVKMTSFGGHESEDVLSALDYLKSLKTDDKTTILVGKDIGIYGVEMGALVGLATAARDENVKVLVLDSAPLESDEVLASAIGRRFPFASSVTAKIARLGTYPYYYDGSYNHESLCGAAANLSKRQVLLLAGVDAPQFQDSTLKLQSCFQQQNQSKIETNTNLAPSGYSLTNASLEQSEAYDQRVIDYFKRTLGAGGETPNPLPTVASN